MYGLKNEQNCEKPLRIEKNKSGKTRKPKLDNARRLRGIYLVDLNFKQREQNWIVLWTQPCRAKKEIDTSNRKLAGGDCI